MKSKVRWSKEEDDFIRNNRINMSCEEMAKKLDRSVKSVMNRCSTLQVLRPAKAVGDVINGWKITEIIMGGQFTMAKIVSITGKYKERTVRLTKLNKGEIAWPAQAPEKLKTGHIEKPSELSDYTNRYEDTWM